MLRFLKRRSAPVTLAELGPLEVAVMDILWSRGERSVRDVVDSVDRPLAYTTVMTTLDRLFKKGLLKRRKAERAYFYSAQLSREELERQSTGDFVAGLLSGPKPRRELLVSCFLDAVGSHDEAMLDELERKIKLKRKELSQRRRQ